MSRTSLVEIDDPEDWEEAVPLLAQLWSDEDDSFVRAFRDEEAYHPLGLTDDGELVAVAGVSVQRVLHHERHAWIHDFVVDEPRRSEGLGAELLAHVRTWARERDCEHLALANRLENEAALAFYEDEGMERWGYVVETDL